MSSKWTVRDTVIGPDKLPAHSVERHPDYSIALTITRKQADQVAECLNALDGIEDPAAALKAAREALGRLVEAPNFLRPGGLCVDVTEREFAKARKALEMLGGGK